MEKENLTLMQGGRTGRTVMRAVAQVYDIVRSHPDLIKHVGDAMQSSGYRHTSGLLSDVADRWRWGSFRFTWLPNSGPGVEKSGRAAQSQDCAKALALLGTFILLMLCDIRWRR